MFDEQYKILKQQEAAVEKVNKIKASFKRTLALQKENAKKQRANWQVVISFTTKL